MIQTFNDQDEAIKQHREGVIRLLHAIGDLIRQLKKQISKPLALAYSPLGDRAKLGTNAGLCNLTSFNKNLA